MLVFQLCHNTGAICRVKSATMRIVRRSCHHSTRARINDPDIETFTYAAVIDFSQQAETSGQVMSPC